MYCYEIHTCNVPFLSIAPLDAYIDLFNVLMSHGEDKCETFARKLQIKQFKCFIEKLLSSLVEKPLCTPGNKQINSLVCYFVPLLLFCISFPFCAILSFLSWSFVLSFDTCLLDLCLTLTFVYTHKVYFLHFTSQVNTH